MSCKILQWNEVILKETLHFNTVINSFQRFPVWTLDLLYREKYRSFTWFPDVEILRKGYIIILLVLYYEHWTDNRKCFHGITNMSAIFNSAIKKEKHVVRMFHV